MPTAPTFPGVYVEEIPSGVRTIVGVSTSTGAFVDRFARGPVDVPVRIFSFADFERVFGGLNRDSEASYGLQQFFLNGGTEAYVVRVGNGLVASVVQVDGGGAVMFNVTAGRRFQGEAVDDPGVWGDQLRIEIDYDTSAPDETFNLTIQEVGLSDGRTVVLRSESYRNLTMEPDTPNYVVDVVNEDSVLVQLDRDGLAALVAPFLPPDATGTQGVALAQPPVIPADSDQFDITIDIDGTATTTIAGTATLSYPDPSSPPTGYAALRPFVQAALRAATAAVAAEQLAFSDHLRDAVVQLANNRFRVLLSRTNPNFDAGATATFTETGAGSTAADLGLLDPGVIVGPQQVALGGGDGGGALDAPSMVGVRANKTAMFALEDADIFNIMCLPAAADLTDTDMRAVYAQAIAYCEERRSFLIIDIPETTDTPDDMFSWLTDNAGLRHKNASTYFPRPKISDPLNQGRLRSVGASGTMAGLYARTDGERGVWKAPAGTEVRLLNVQDLDYALTNGENGALNPLGVNALRNFPVFGNISWGARTLDGADQLASEWKYIPVRRIALFLEETLFRNLKWVVFEPNDEPLWSQIRLNVGAFMQSLFRQGAFQGQTAKEAYFVKCDAETTTQTDINLGIVNVVVGFAPLKPAEFVIIKIQQIAGQIPT